MKLPELFKNKLNDDINNNEKAFVSFLRKEDSKEDIFKKLPVIVNIVTKKGESIKTRVIGKTKNFIITKDRSVIDLKDIKEIKKI